MSDAVARLAIDSLAYSLLTAGRVLAAVIGGSTLDAALAELTPPPLARPAVMDHAYQALRRYGLGDFWLSRLMERQPADPLLRGLLLVSLARLSARPDEVHTTVDQAVTAAAGLAGGRYKGLVNGVLRNALRRQAELSAGEERDDTARWQHPHWWLAALRKAYPRDWQAIATADNRRPPMTLRVNRRYGGAREYLASLDETGLAGRALDSQAILLDRPVAVDRLPGFAEGRVSVQDWGAQQAAPLLDATEGMRVLDACAAPGGKTAHLLETAHLELTALDADARRAIRIGENMARLGLAATITVADCRKVDDWWDGRPFDRILADVPCTASGVVRRHPDIKWLRRKTDIDGFSAVQAEIIEALWPTLAPGGKMLYATCSLFPEENGLQVASFVARHDDALRLPTVGDEYEWQLMPNGDHDGFYYALLAKS
jgi:16S rRNA (cytosine967-C5)-methyltransferase